MKASRFPSVLRKAAMGCMMMYFSPLFFFGTSVSVFVVVSFCFLPLSASATLVTGVMSLCFATSIVSKMLYITICPYNPRSA